MKTLFILSILLLLQACLYQSVDEIDILLANEECKNNGGIQSINIYVGVNTHIEYKDGVNQTCSSIAKDLHI